MSDWRSDVCSSDLQRVLPCAGDLWRAAARAADQPGGAARGGTADAADRGQGRCDHHPPARRAARRAGGAVRDRRAEGELPEPGLTKKGAALRRRPFFHGKKLLRGVDVRLRDRRDADFDAAVALAVGLARLGHAFRSEEHTSELQSLMRSSYAVVRWKKKQ